MSGRDGSVGQVRQLRAKQFRLTVSHHPERHIIIGSSCSKSLCFLSKCCCKNSSVFCGIGDRLNIKEHRLRWRLSQLARASIQVAFCSVLTDDPLHRNMGDPRVGYIGNFSGFSYVVVLPLLI